MTAVLKPEPPGHTPLTENAEAPEVQPTDASTLETSVHGVITSIMMA